MIVSLFFAFAALLSSVTADVKFTSPAAGASLSGTSISITWADSGVAPPLSDLKTYQIFLCAGGNDANQITVLAPLTVAGDFSTGNKFLGTFEVTLGGTTKNAYFLKIISAATGGVVINYSSRFTLTDMTGTFPVTVQNALKTVSGTSGPATQNQIAVVNAAGAAAAVEGGGDYAVTYTMQSGPTRFAPMAKRPGTKITKKNQSPIYPQSSWTPYKTIAPPASVAVFTMTQQDPSAVSSREATMIPAAMPTDSDLQKFLNRWKD